MVLFPAAGHLLLRANRVALCCLLVLLLPRPAQAAEPVRLQARIKAIRFTSDHHLLRHNESNVLVSGDPYPDIHWVASPRRSVPISHSGGPTAHIQALIVLALAGAGEDVPFVLQGISEEPGLCFRAEGNLPSGEEVSIPISARHALGYGARKINRKISWLLTTYPGEARSDTIILGSTGPHVVYVTLGTPKHTDDPRHQVTDSRMELAIARVGEAMKAAGAAASPPWIVYELMKQNGAHYLPTRHYGGAKAWQLPESWALSPPGASCISIVEFVALLCDMVGLEGSAATTAFYANATNPHVARQGGLGDPPLFKDGPNKERWQLFLIDQSNTKHGQVGGVGGVNYYEAALEFDWRGKKYYYPGGTDRVYEAPEKVLCVFRTLAWAQWEEHQHDWVVREVVHTYVRPGEKYPPSTPLPR